MALSPGQSTSSNALIRNLGTAAVGVQMVRGVPVGNGVFVVLSIIDIGQAVARTYSSTEERNIAITYTAIASALNLALMIAGQALMKIPNPVTMIGPAMVSSSIFGSRFQRSTRRSRFWRIS